MRDRKPHQPKKAVEPSSRLLAVSLGLFLAIAPFIITSNLYDYADLPKALFIKFGALIFGIGFIVSASRSTTGFRLIKNPLDGPILAFLAWSLLSAIWAYDKYGVLLRLSHLVGAWLIYLVLREKAGERERKAVAIALVCSSFLVSVLGLLQSWADIQWVLQTREPASTFGNKLLAADFIVFAVPVLFMVVFTGRRVLTRIVALVVLATNVTYLVVAVTKGGVVAVFVEFLATVVLLALPALRAARKDRVRLVFAASGLVILLAASAVALEVTGKINWMPQAWNRQFALLSRTVRSEITGQTTDPLRAIAAPVTPNDSSLSLRLAVWRNTLALIADHPLIGVGLSNFQVLYPAYAFAKAVDTRVMINQEWPQTHNDHLQTLAELGIVGILLAGWFLLCLGGVVLRLLGRPEGRPTVIACSTAILGLLVDMFVDFPLQTALVPLPAAVCIGLLASEIETDRPVHHKPSNSTGLVNARKALFPLIAAVGFLAWGTWVQIWEVAGSYYLLRTLAARERQQWPDVIASGTEAVRLNHRSHEAFQFLSEAYYQAGMPAEAAQAAQAVLKIRPFYVGALNNLAVARAKMGDRQGAIEAYQRAVKMTPYNGQMHGAIGWLCLSEKRYAEAVDSFRAARRYSPDDPAYAFGLGLGHYYLTELGQAREVFQQAADKAPPTAQYYYYLALTEMRLGQLAEADVNVSKALKLAPESREAKSLSRALASLRSRTAAPANQDR